MPGTIGDFLTFNRPHACHPSAHAPCAHDFLAGWINEEQQRAIEYLRTENQVLREQLGKQRILLNDDQRRRLSVKGRLPRRRLLEEYGTLFTPDTILRWHRLLVAQKWDTPDRRQPSRPRIRQVIVDLIIRFAKENPTWGYDRIQGALSNVGYLISDSTVANVLRKNGIEPAPDRKRQTTWSMVLKAHWDVIALRCTRTLRRMGEHDCG